MGKASAGVIFVAALVVVVLVAGVTVAAVEVLDVGEGTEAVPSATTVEPTVPSVAPRTGQAIVTGTASAFSAEGVAFEPLSTEPALVVTTPSRGLGAGATVSGVTVGGREATIEWDAGRPFDLRGEGGALLPAFVNVYGDAAGVTVGLPDRVAHRLAPGTYTLRTPVAVGGRGGLAEPLDTVTFVATEASRVTFRGGASTGLAPRPLELAGPGTVVIAGQLEVRLPAGSSPAGRVELADSPFELSVVPATGGYAVDAVLQGDVVSS